VPALIERALAKSIPVLIGARAAILGISGIANKVKSFFQALSKLAFALTSGVHTSSAAERCDILIDKYSDRRGCRAPAESTIWVIWHQAVEPLRGRC